MTTERPTDEATAKVVSEWKDTPPLQYEDNGFSGWFFAMTAPKAQVQYLDPRDDTDAALELLHWLLLNEMEGLSYPQLGGGYYIGTDHYIPATSGPDFRYAVVNLAVRVMAEGGN